MYIPCLFLARLNFAYLFAIIGHGHWKDQTELDMGS